MVEYHTKRFTAQQIRGRGVRTVEFQQAKCVVDQLVPPLPQGLFTSP